MLRPSTMGWTDRSARRPATWPWWAQVLTVYAATRAISTVFLVLLATRWPDRYSVVVGTFWDATWYRRIVESGYPSTLPLDETGAVAENSWAFYPLFPYLVRGLLAVTGGTWNVVAPTTALVLGAAAMLVIDRLVQGEVDARAPRPAPEGAPSSRRLALGTVLLLGVHPASPVFQVAYTESLSLLLVAAALLLLRRRSYGAVAACVVALGFTRPVALPMVAVIGVHLLVRWRAARRGAADLPRGDVVRIVALGAVAVVAGVAWPLLAGVVTGVPDAYLQTQAAWRGGFSLAPFVPWVQMAAYLADSWGPLVLTLFIAAVATLGLSPPARAAGVEVQAWGLAYPAWLLVIAFPQTSTYRFSLLAFPLVLALVGLARTWWGVGALAVASVVGQAWWLLKLTTYWPA